MQVALTDGRLAFSAVNNIPHAERHGMFPFIRLHTTRAQVSSSMTSAYEWVMPQLAGPIRCVL